MNPHGPIREVLAANAALRGGAVWKPPSFVLATVGPFNAPISQGILQPRAGPFCARIATRDLVGFPTSGGRADDHESGQRRSGGTAGLFRCGEPQSPFHPTLRDATINSVCVRSAPATSRTPDRFP